MSHPKALVADTTIKKIQQTKEKRFGLVIEQALLPDFLEGFGPSRILAHVGHIDKNFG